MYIFASCMCRSYGGRRQCWIRWSVSYRQLCAAMWVLGTECRLSGRIASAEPSPDVRVTCFPLYVVWLGLAWCSRLNILNCSCPVLWWKAGSPGREGIKLVVKPHP